MIVMILNLLSMMGNLFLGFDCGVEKSRVDNDAKVRKRSTVHRKKDKEQCERS